MIVRWHGNVNWILGRMVILRAFVKSCFYLSYTAQRYQVIFAVNCNGGHCKQVYLDAVVKVNLLSLQLII